MRSASTLLSDPGFTESCCRRERNKGSHPFDYFSPGGIYLQTHIRQESQVNELDARARPYGERNSSIPDDKLRARKVRWREGTTKIFLTKI